MATDYSSNVQQVPMRLTTRFVRVAFIVNKSVLTSDLLDQVVRISLTRWGGRYFPIVLSDGHRLDPESTELLAVYDPDQCVLVGIHEPALIASLYGRHRPCSVVHDEA